MHEYLRRDGAVVLTGDDDDPDQVVVKGTIVNFTPSQHGARCICGAALQPWSLRPTSEGAELYCSRCHQVHGSITVGVRVHR
jgi:hypothetical protein